MTRNLKALGLALVALCAFGALSASSASAFFDANAEHVNIKGTQTNNHVFTTAVGTVTCKKATFTGTSLSTEKLGDGYWTTKDVTVHPVYSECTAFGFSATVTTTGCDYTFTRTGTDAEGTPIGPVHVVCEPEKKIKIVAAGFCTMEVGAQTPTGHVAYHNKNVGTAAEDVEVTSTVEGIAYTGNCGSGNTGKYTGNATVQATDTAGAAVRSKVT